MKQLLIYLMLMCLTIIGYSQNQKSMTGTDIKSQSGPQMKQVQMKKDYLKDMHKPLEEDKKTSAEFHSGKLIFTSHKSKSNTGIKYLSATDSKPKQILNNNNSPNFGKDRVQYFSKIKSKNKLQRVNGYVQREEIIKITGHPQYDQEILIEALGNVRPIKATTVKVESRK